MAVGVGSGWAGVEGERIAPQRVAAAHIADQFADLFRYQWPSGLSMTSFPCPKQPETLAVPGNHSFRLYLDAQDRMLQNIMIRGSGSARNFCGAHVFFRILVRIDAGQTIVSNH